MMKISRNTNSAKPFNPCHSVQNDNSCAFATTATRPKIFSTWTQVFSENCFVTSEKPPIWGCFLLHSRFNHSCLPNTKILEVKAGETITSLAVKEIAASEEITICYNNDFEVRTTDERHKALRFPVVCNCKACLPGTTFQQLSDMRRTLVRGLNYLLHGRDLDGSKSTTIIVDPEMKKAAQELNITLSARLVYNVLVMVLLDQEGLLDDIQAEKFGSRVLQMPNLFKTESNTRIAKLVVVQQTPLDKFCVANKLYGQADAGDELIAALFRRQRQPM
jgi:hypothetical protein